MINITKLSEYLKDLENLKIQSTNNQLVFNYAQKSKRD
jgi:hypothetical protein